MEMIVSLNDSILLKIIEKYVCEARNDQAIPAIIAICSSQKLTNIFFSNIDEIVFN